MDLKHLQALIGIADQGSFSAAAVAIGTVQSNISAHIARLEREIDVVLVDRSSGRLTAEGLIVVGRARRMMGELEAMVADVAAIREDVSGTVRVGMIGTTGRWLVPQLFDAVREQHPRVFLRVTDGTSSSLEPQLISGQLDLAVMTLPVPSEELSAVALFEEDLMLVVPTEHPLARAHAGNGAAALPLSVLDDLTLLLPVRGTALRDEIDAAAEPAGITLHPSMELDGVRMLASLTFDGHGPAILPATAIPRHLRDRFVPLALEGFPRRRVGIAVRRQGLPSAPSRAVMDLLRTVVRDPESVPEGLHPSGPPVRR